VVKNFVQKNLKKFHRRFFTAVFFGGGQISPYVKPYSDRSINTLHRFQKSGGIMGSLF
jgi:hypothetical protein